MTFKLGIMEKHRLKDTGTKLEGVAMTTKPEVAINVVNTGFCTYPTRGSSTAYILYSTDFALCHQALRW